MKYISVTEAGKRFAALLDAAQSERLRAAGRHHLAAPGAKTWADFFELMRSIEVPEDSWQSGP